MSIFEKFKKEHQSKGRVSAMQPYNDNILELKKLGYSNRQVWEYLQLEGVTLALSTVNDYIANLNKSSKQAEVTREEKVPTQTETKIAEPAPVKKPATIADKVREQEERRSQLTKPGTYIAPSWCIDKTPVEELMAPAKKK